MWREYTFEMLSCCGKFLFKGYRKFIIVNHAFQIRKSWVDGNEEHENAPKIMSDKMIFEYLKYF